MTCANLQRVRNMPLCRETGPSPAAFTPGSQSRNPKALLFASQPWKPAIVYGVTARRTFRTGSPGT